MKNTPITITQLAMIEDPILALRSPGEHRLTRHLERELLDDLAPVDLNRDGGRLVIEDEEIAAEYLRRFRELHAKIGTTYSLPWYNADGTVSEYVTKVVLTKEVWLSVGYSCWSSRFHRHVYIPDCEIF